MTAQGYSNMYPNASWGSGPQANPPSPQWPQPQNYGGAVHDSAQELPSEGKRFMDLVNRIRTEPALRQRFDVDPDGVLSVLGTLPAKARQDIIGAIRRSLAPQATAQMYVTGLEYASMETHWWGVSVYLSSKAVSDLTALLDGGAGAAGIASAIPSVSTPVALIIAGALLLSSTILKLADRGNGVDINIPWSSFGPGQLPIIIPTPH